MGNSKGTTAFFNFYLNFDNRKLEKVVKYCIDKYDFYSGDGTGFTNLARLMENTPER